MELKINDLKDNQLVWACGYSTNSTEKSMAFRKKPILGIVIFPYNSRKDKGEFYEVNKKGEVKTKCVNIRSRHYANTEEESIEIYNNLVLKQISILQTLVDNCRDDFISNEED